MGFYYFAICHVCKKPSNDLKKCSKCKVVHYCSRAHQIRDWSSHKELCKVMTETATYLKFTPGAGPATFTKYKVQHAIIWQFELGRELETFEHEMWMFPKACSVCYSFNVNLICQTCWSVAYCNEEHKNTHKGSHDQFCQALKLCLEIHQALETEGRNPWKLMKFDFTEDIQTLPATIEDLVQLLAMINNLDLSEKPIESILLTDVFCTSANLIYALEKCRFLDKRRGKRIKLIIHVITIELNEITDWSNLMELLSHWIYNLKNLQIFIVSPEHENDDRRWFKMDCEFCKKKRFSGFVTFIKGEYLEVVEELPRPDAIVMFNGNLPITGSFEWGETIPKLVQHKGVPIILTGHTQHDLQIELWKFPANWIRFYLGPEENRYGSRRPVRNCDSAADPVVYRNRFIAMLAKK